MPRLRSRTIHLTAPKTALLSDFSWTKSTCPTCYSLPLFCCLPATLHLLDPSPRQEARSHPSPRPVTLLMLLSPPPRFLLFLCISCPPPSRSPTSPHTCTASPGLSASRLASFYQEPSVLHLLCPRRHSGLQGTYILVEFIFQRERNDNKQITKENVRVFKMVAW